MGHGWAKPERIKMGCTCIWVNLKKVGPTFLQVNLSLYRDVIYTLESHSHLLCGRDFANERLLLCQFDVWNS